MSSFANRFYEQSSKYRESKEAKKDANFYGNIQKVASKSCTTYIYFHRHCSQEIRDIIPVPLRHVRSTRSSTHSYPSQVYLPNLLTLSCKSSFIPRTCNLWKVLPSSWFPESYNLLSFKSKINQFDLISLLLAFRFLLCSFVGALYRPRWPFLNIIY